jgi:anti-sigma factor RsiW
MTRLPTCREVLDFLSAYLDCELPPDVRAGFERHLELCPPCVEYLESYRETLRLERDAFDLDGPVPPDVPDELVRAIVARKGTGTF